MMGRLWSGTKIWVAEPRLFSDDAFWALAGTLDAKWAIPFRDMLRSRGYDVEIGPEPPTRPPRLASFQRIRQAGDDPDEWWEDITTEREGNA